MTLTTSLALVNGSFMTGLVRACLSLSRRGTLEHQRRMNPSLTQR